MNTNKSVSIVLAILFVLGTQILVARTRSDFIDGLKPYVETSWTCNANNLLDLYINQTLPFDKFDLLDIENIKAVELSDTFDDRRGINKNPYYWPYYLNMPTVHGLAYAFGGMDSPEQFNLKIKSSGKYIAGAREADYWAGVPGVYAGYAGIDCSGLVSRLVGITDINKKWGVQNGDISYYCMQKNAAKIEPGDLLVYKTYKHVVICGDGDPNSQLTIYQATPNKYSDGEHVRRVVCENVSSRVVDNGIMLTDKLHYVYTPFPLFDSIYPSGVKEVSDTNNQIIPVKVYVASRLGFNLIMMRLDGADITSDVQQNSFDSMYEVKYIPQTALNEGRHTVIIKVANDAGLEDEEYFEFFITASIDSDADGIPDNWEDKYKDKVRDDDDLTDLQEYTYGTDPTNSNTDSGGVDDLTEINQGTNPLVKEDDYSMHKEKPAEEKYPYVKKDTKKQASKNSVATTARDPNAMYGPDGQISPGQVLNYTVEFENIGEGIAYGIYIADQLDQNIDDAQVTVSNCRRIDYISGAETPALFEYKSDPQTRMLTVFIDNEGEVGPKQGGKFDISVLAKGSIARGTAIINTATVYFPSVPEETPTNSIVSVVPLNSAIEYNGTKVVSYSDLAELSA